MDALHLKTGKPLPQNQGSMGGLFNYHCLLQCKSDAKRRAKVVTPAGVLTATDWTFKCFLEKIASVFFDGKVVQLHSRWYGFLSTLLHEMCVKPVLFNLLSVLSLGQERKENPPHSGDAGHSRKPCQLHG